jgi:hypothetical protein
MILCCFVGGGLASYDESSGRVFYMILCCFVGGGLASYDESSG